IRGIGGAQTRDRPLQPQPDGVIVDLGLHAKVYDRLGGDWIQKVDGALFHDETISAEEQLSTCEVSAPQHDGMGSRTRHAKIGVATDTNLAALKIHLRG